MSSLLCREFNTGGRKMVQECRTTIADLGTLWTSVRRRVESSHIGTTMFPNKVEYPICLCKCLIRATRTFERCGFLLGMPRRYVKSESLRVKKLLLTRRTLKRQTPLVILQMIVHRILILLHGLTNMTNKLALLVFLVSVRHSLYQVSGAAPLQFFPSAPRTTPSTRGRRVRWNSCQCFHLKLCIATPPPTCRLCSSCRSRLGSE